MKNLLLVIALLIGFLGFSQVERIEPPNWWIGFQDTNVQLLVKDANISAAAATINYPGVTLLKVEKGSSPNYLFLDVQIDSGAKPGKFDIVFTYKNNKKKKHSYELKARKKKSQDFIGFNSSDVIYLITPDRFANGNASNDVMTGLLEKSINRKDDYGRHGGDIQGIIENMNYIDEMGFTAIWPSPLLTNDMKESSYHGYAMTDFYEVDPRFGTLEAYILLAKTAESKGIKLIMDQVANHCGINHWWMLDLPFTDWINYQSYFEKNKDVPVSNHRRTANQDRYVSLKDKNLLGEGWFVSDMPDLNQRNPFLAKYIIQNSIWWIETLGLGGIRQDTYPYPDKEFMADWAGAIMKEYPNFSIVGEEWSNNPLLVGYWQQGATNKDGYVSNLTSPMDFPMQKYVVDALNEEEKWDTGLVKMYEGLANDFHYANPAAIMIFPDNHDMDRIYTQLHKNKALTKMALSYMLTLPRIPQIYYGTEILMENSAKPGDHGLIRTDFPGGWKEDKTNGFTGAGLSADQLEMQDFLRSILNYRKNSVAIHQGKTIHFAPHNGTYTLFRIQDDEVVMLISNKNKTAVTIDLNQFEEIGLKGKKYRNVVTGEAAIFGDTLEIFTEGPILLTTKM